jgi:tRNA (guanine-N7-)-methyltransferase
VQDLTSHATPMRRRARMTAGRHRRWDTLWPRFGLAAEEVGAFRPELLDIGFGTGESLLDLAARYPAARVLGVEVYRPGLIRVMEGLPGDAPERVRLVDADVLDLLPHLPPGSLRLVQVFFPDPWPKRRHAGRRLLRGNTLPHVTALLAPGGVLHVATDAAGYAAEVAELCADRPELAAAPPPPRPATRYESLGRAAGRGIHDLAWRRVG